MQKNKKGLWMFVMLIIIASLSTYLVNEYSGYEETEDTEEIEDTKEIMQNEGMDQSNGLNNSIEQGNETTDSIVSGFETAIVDHVIDGDTVQVIMDGEAYKVRLIGINCPESVHADASRNTEAGALASKFTASICTEGMTVYLQKDVSDTDQYGRLLRYVWLEYPEDPFDFDTVESYMLNAIIVKNGHSDARDYEPDTLYSEYLKALN
jgi:micrococcal nuclease